MNDKPRFRPAHIEQARCEHQQVYNGVCLKCGQEVVAYVRPDPAECPHPYTNLAYRTKITTTFYCSACGTFVEYGNDQHTS